MTRTYQRQFPLHIRSIVGYIHSHLLKFSPSHHVCNHSSTITSADFLPFVITTSLILCFLLLTRPSLVPHISLSPYIFHIYHSLFRVVIGFLFDSNLILNCSLMWFLFARPEIYLWLPSDSTPRWTHLSFVSFPLLGRIRDLRPLETWATRRTYKSPCYCIYNNKDFYVFLKNY